MNARKRQPITPVSLFTAGVVLFLAAAVASPQIFGFREAARRTQCSNNLKQLGLAVHNYHDVNRQLPALATDKDGFSWATYMLPYVERQNVYKQLVLHEAAKAEENKKLVSDFKHPAFLCPSRRTKAERKDGPFKGGQPMDYVAVSTIKELKWSAETKGTIIFRAAPPAENRPVRSATTFASILDGLSNTAMIGEKHMHATWLGGKFDEPALAAFNNQNTIRIASDEDKKRGLAGPKENKDDDAWRFGSWHPKITLFLRGDGSVAVVKNTAEPKVLTLFCGRDDGKVFELP